MNVIKKILSKIKSTNKKVYIFTIILVFFINILFIATNSSSNHFILNFEFLKKVGDQHHYISLANNIVNFNFIPHVYSVGYSLFLAPLLIILQTSNWEDVSRWAILIQSFVLTPFIWIFIVFIFKTTGIKLFRNIRNNHYLLAILLLLIFFMAYEFFLLLNSKDPLAFHLFWGLVPYSETFAIFILTAIYAIIFAKNFKLEKSTALFIGILTSFVIMTRITFLFLVVPVFFHFFLALLKKDFKKCLYFIMGIIIGYLPQFIYNWVAFDNILASGYNWHWEKVQHRYIPRIENIFGISLDKQFSFYYFAHNAQLLFFRYFHFLILAIINISLIVYFRKKISNLSKADIFFLLSNVGILLYLVIYLFYWWSAIPDIIDRFLLPLPFIFIINFSYFLKLQKKKLQNVKIAAIQSLKDFIASKYYLILFFLFFVLLVIKGCLLIYPDLNLTYRYLSSDSYDWIANGLFYAGYDINFSGRPPGLPLIISLLERMNLLNLLPLLNQLALFGILYVSYLIIAKYFGKIVSSALSLMLFLNFFLQSISLYILADIYAVFFIILGYYFYIEAERKERKYIFAFLFWSISFLFQYAIALFVLPAIILHFFLFKKNITAKTALLSSLIPIIFAVGVFISKKVFFNDFMYSEINYFKLLRLHFNGLFFYFINIISILSIPLTLLIFAGILIFFLQKKQGELMGKFYQFIYLNIFTVLFWIIFWVLLYDWNDRRFVLYLMPFLFPFMALSIQSMINFFWDKNYICKLAVIFILVFSIWSSALSYRSFFVSDRIKLTDSHIIKFEYQLGTKSSGSLDIIPSSLVIEKTENDFYPLDFETSKVRKNNVNYKKIDNFKNINEIIATKRIRDLCISSKAKTRWYATKNEIGNFFKLRTAAFPDECKNPNLFINSNGYLDILSD